MPTHLNLRYAEIEELMPGIQRFQKLAEHYGVTDIFQDAGGKMVQLAVATGLDLMPGRLGPDASDRIGNIYEIKTTDLDKTQSGWSTNHHVTKTTLQGYKQRRWVFATYRGIILYEAYLMLPEQLKPLFAQWERVLKTKNHINNPKIGLRFVRENGRVMYMKDVAPDWATRNALVSAE